MKVRLLTCMAGINFVYNAGDEIEFSKDEAMRLIDAKIAEPIRRKRVERAVKTPNTEKAVIEN